MKRWIIPLGLCICCSLCLQAQRIGINTLSPQAMLHVKDSSVLFSLTSLPGTPGNPPAIGTGVRMMWYAPKAAFRVGEADATSWNKDSIGLHSFATGKTTKAKGQYSFASGFNSEALGSSSMALGEEVTATGARSIAMGFNSQATTDYSVAIGRQVTASDVGATAVGYGTKANGLGSTSMGYFNTSEGAYSTTMGFSTQSLGQMSLATGYDTEAEGIVSIAGGYRSVSTGSYSMAVGFQSHSVPFASLAIGRFNIDTVGSSNTWVATDPVFMIGDGDDDATRSNSFTVLKNGKTAINGDNPLAALSIKGYDGTENNHLRLEDNNSIETGSIFYTGDLFFKNSRVGGDFFFRNNENSNVLVLFSTGNTTISGTLTQNSDARLKKNFRLLESPLQKVLRLNAYHYYWSDPWRDHQLQTGFKAQDIETVMPELVTTAADGIKSVNYTGIIPYLAEAIKELKQQNDELKKEVEELKKNASR